jgi:hypothetical protein
MQNNMRRSLIYGLALVLFILLVAIVKAGGRPFGFVDAHVYSTAITSWIEGSDPYAHKEFMNFLYPPVILIVWGYLAKVGSLPILRAAYIGLHLSAALLLPWILYRYYLRKSTWTPTAFYLLFFLSPGLLGLLALDTGNIALICYVAALVAGIAGLQRNRWLSFYLIVFCCAAIKITFLPLLFLPLYAGNKQLRRTVLCAAAAIVCLATQAWLLPDLYRRFREIVTRQSTQLGDDGWGVFGILVHVAHKAGSTSLLVPALAYGAVATSILVFLTVMKRKRLDSRLPAWPAIVVASILFLMPRVNYYDLCVGFPLIFCLFTQNWRRANTLLLYLSLSVPSLILILLLRLRYTAFNGGFEALIMLGMLTAIFRTLLTLDVTALANNWTPEVVHTRGDHYALDV